jgi:NADPH2:quinone reductase
MKAVICRELGPPERLVFDELPDPPLGPNDVRIAVKAASVNFPDALIIQGKYQVKATPPFVPGAEVAGVVQECGDRVQNFRPGDGVVAFIPTGGYAEQVVASAHTVVALPPAVDFTTAAAATLAYGTSLHALKQRGRLAAGETLLVLGAAGGVGLAAVQIGKQMGARVIAAASSDDKLALCREYGADETVNYGSASLKEEVKKLTKGRGVDVIYDPVGGDLAQDCLSCIAWKGRYLIVGFAAGGIPELAANRLLLKGAAAVGVFWGAFTAHEPQANAENIAQLFAWIRGGQIKPYISRTYPLAQAPQALRDMLDRKVTGKIVLLP